jgi:hypothetical protein
VSEVHRMLDIMVHAAPFMGVVRVFLNTLSAEEFCADQLWFYRTA